MAPEEIVGLVGPNGSGKTTLINVISGHYALDRGRVALGTTVLSARPAHRVAGLGISRTYQIPRPFAQLSALDEEHAREHDHGPSAGAVGSVTLRRRGPRRRGVASRLPLSGRQQQWVVIGRALMARPRLLLLDEPSLGLAPAVVDAMFGIIRAIHDEGVAILLVEQNVVRALDIADRAFVLEEGRIVADGPPDALRRESRIQEAYLGVRQTIEEA